MDPQITPDLSNLLAIGIVGAGLSLVMELVPSAVASKWKKAIVILGAVGAGWAYTAVKDTQIFPTILQVLMSAQTIYALFLKKDTVAPNAPPTTKDSTELPTPPVVPTPPVNH